MKYFTNKRIIKTILFVLITIVLPKTIFAAAILAPGNITTCGELAAPGTYTLQNDVSGGSGTCFTISSNGVTINGQDYTISGTSGDVAIDARKRDSGAGSSLSNGGSALTNLLISALNITGYTTGVNISGNDSTSGFAGDAGTTEIFYSSIGDIVANGGVADAETYGGTGGLVTLTDVDLDISNNSYTALGGSGTVGLNTDGVINLDYSGTLTHDGAIFSKLSFFNDNEDQYSYYPGGTYPLTPGDITTCGTLASSTTYTLTGDITSAAGTCFLIAADDVIIEGAGYTIYPGDASSTSYAIDAEYGDYDNLVINNLDFINYLNVINSTQSVTINSTSTIDLSNINITTSNLVNLTINASSTIDLSSSTISVTNIVIGGLGDFDLSNATITADVLDLDYFGDFTYTGTYISDLSNLSIANYDYRDIYTAGLLSDFERGFGENWNAYGPSEIWRSIAMTPNGTKLAAVSRGGQIHISTDVGLNWTPYGPSESWRSIAMTPNGTKLAAVDFGGKIHISTDGGLNWNAYGPSENWMSIAMTPDGTKLAAVDRGGKIHISTDGGLNWNAYGPSESWFSVAMSSDGTKLAAVDYGGQIHISTEGGLNWNAFGSNEDWNSIVMSSDGTKLAAVSRGGQIHISTDGGLNWTPYGPNENWRSVAMSSDGTKLAAVDYGGQIHISTNGGLNWNAYGPSESWSSVAMSSDGTKLAAVDFGGQIHISDSFAPELSVSILNPAGISDVNVFNPVVSWGTAKYCYYSYDSFSSTSTADCGSLGSDISEPTSYGTSTLYIKGIDSNETTATSSVEFNYSEVTIVINFPGEDGSYTNKNWNPNVNFDVSNSLASTTCYYSYDNFTSTSTTDCVNNGSDIEPPNNYFATSTLYLKTIDDGGNVYTDSVIFEYTTPWGVYGPNESWYSVSMSSDGTKLAAVSRDEQIHISTDGGLNWTPYGPSESWSSVAMSSDGTKLAAVDQGGKIHISTNGGLNWNAYGPSESWSSVAMSSYGTKLAAVGFGGQIHISIDGGLNWTPYGPSESWSSVAMSSDGTKLAAVDRGGQIHISTEGGLNWNAYGPSEIWRSIAMTPNGTKLAAVSRGGQIHISTDVGLNWTPYGPSENWYSVAMTPNGTKLAAVDFGGKIHISTNGGLNWNAYGPSENWMSIAMTPDGTKLAAVDYGGQIHINNQNQDFVVVEVANPIYNQQLTSWSPEIDWGVSDNCYYSFDGFSSTTTIDCTLGGSDISEPDSGTSTLSLFATSEFDSILDYNNNIIFSLQKVSSINQSLGLEKYWSSNSISGKGNVIVAFDNDTTGYFGGAEYGYVSNDGGDTFTELTSLGKKAWNSSTISFSGKYVAATVSSGQIYTSDDYGDTWTAQESNRNWTSIASDASGARLAATVSSGQIYTSDDYGDTWTAQESNRNWTSIASDASGARLAATVSSGQIYTSDDYGDTWTAQESNRNWTSIASDASGQYLSAGFGKFFASGGVYTSDDYGASWTSNTYISDISTELTVVSLSTVADGSVTLVASSLDTTGDFVPADLYKISNNNGIKIHPMLPSDQSQISEFNLLISWSSAETCSYSYDGTVYTIVDCDADGSDIELPSSTGTSTLYIKGVDSNSVEDIASSTFSLQGFYYCGTSDNDWNNDSNWYSDESCSATTTAPVSQSNLAFAVGTTSPVISSSTDPIPLNINTTGLTGSAKETGVIFSDNVSYSGLITGNATFNDSSYNTGTIIGNATLNTDYYGSTQTGGVFTVGTGVVYQGDIQGTVFDSESNTITNYVFEGSSQNEGVVNVDATFNNTSEFQVGTVNATATLNGENQIIKGVNSVINFFKQLTTNITDTLFFRPTATLDVSGIFTLLGKDENNFLTVRSTTPGSSYNLGINGTSNFNFLKLRDAVNTGTLLDLSAKNVLDDGNNTGFTFPSASTRSSRSFSSTNNSSPSLPVSRGGVAPASATTGDGNTSSSNSTQRLNSFFGNDGVQNFDFTPLQEITPFFNTETFVPNEVGVTRLPNVFTSEFGAPSSLDFRTIPNNLAPSLDSFVFQSISGQVQQALNERDGGILAASLGINRAQELATLSNKPIRIEDAFGTSTPDGIYTIYSGVAKLQTYITYDLDLGNLAQKVTVTPEQLLNIGYIPTGTSTTHTIQFQGETIQLSPTFDGYYAASITTPINSGKYILRSNTSSLTLIIEVQPPLNQQTKKTWGPFNWLWKLFH